MAVFTDDLLAEGTRLEAGGCAEPRTERLRNGYPPAGDDQRRPAARRLNHNRFAAPRRARGRLDALAAVSRMILVRPSRRPLGGLLRMTFFLNGIIDLTSS